MLRRALILSSNREYAQTMRQGLLKMAGERAQIDIELDAIRALQLGPQQYDLVLIDTVLDAMDGLQVLALIKVQAPAGKFVMVSDSSDETSRAVAYQNGADFFLERPRTPEAFDVALDALRGMFKPGTADGPAPDEENPLVSLADIVQMRCLSGDSVLLLARSKAVSGDIFIFRGEVFHAQYPGKGGEAALHDMLRWDGGRVRIKTIKLTHVPPRTIEVPYTRLLASMEKAGPVRENPAGEGELYAIASDAPPDLAALAGVKEAPPRAEPVPPSQIPDRRSVIGIETPLPHVSSHWQVSLTGELMEGSQVLEPDRCAFITTFIYRKLADVAVALEVDYFNHMTLLGPHLQQVLVADNIGVRHAVFDTAWTKEEQRLQYIKWCREQSF